MSGPSISAKMDLTGQARAPGPTRSRGSATPPDNACHRRRPTDSNGNIRFVPEVCPSIVTVVLWAPVKTASWNRYPTRDRVVTVELGHAAAPEVRIRIPRRAPELAPVWTRRFSATVMLVRDQKVLFPESFHTDCWRTLKTLMNKTKSRKRLGKTRLPELAPTVYDRWVFLWRVWKGLKMFEYMYGCCYTHR